MRHAAVRQGEGPEIVVIPRLQRGNPASARRVVPAERRRVPVVASPGLAFQSLDITLQGPNDVPAQAGERGREVV